MSMYNQLNKVQYLHSSHNSSSSNRCSNNKEHHSKDSK